MNDIENTKQLLELLQGNSDSKNAEKNKPENIDYVIYARKSTVDEGRQERSIPDQIDDCMKSCIKPEKLRISKIIEEKYSAKEPDTRPKFRDMMNDIKSGKYEGLIAWHPDRLARNMKEAGEIIDLLDKGILKSLKFATSTFENSPTGKMLLGISFVLSKQYSEHLSESVSRGNRAITEKGQFIGQMKHGYLITKNRELQPDDQNFTIIKRAFEKRIEGESQNDIMKWLNSTGYMVRRWQNKPETYEWDKDAVSKLLRDPVYAGVLRYGKNYVILSDIYDFTPAVEVKDFLKINKTSSFASPKLVSSMVVKNRKKRANYLNGIVHCGYCHKPFSSGITTKKLKDGLKEERYYYRCETLTCPFRNKSVQSTKVTFHIYQFFQEHQFTTKENYNYWLAKVKNRLKDTTKETESRIQSLSKTIAFKKQEYEETKTIVRKNKALEKHYDLDAILKEITKLDEEQAKLIQTRKEAREALPTYEKYLELMHNVSDVLLNEEESELKDSVVRVFFSNFTVTADSFEYKRGYDITHKLKEPWYGFLKSNNFVHGRGYRT